MPRLMSVTPVPYKLSNLLQRQLRALDASIPRADGAQLLRAALRDASQAPEKLVG